MSKLELFKFAHSIAKHKNIAFYGSYAKAFGAVLSNLYAKGYHKGPYTGFQIVEPRRLLA